jgi:hypothetical protein
MAGLRTNSSKPLRASRPLREAKKHICVEPAIRVRSVVDVMYSGYDDALA